MNNHETPTTQSEDTKTHEAREQLFDHEICEELITHLLTEHESQRLQFKESPDVCYKLNVHFPSVYEISKRIAPEDFITQTAALYHDYGRIPQFELKGDFNDGTLGSEQDHHVIGYHAFLEDAPKILESCSDFTPLIINDSAKSGAISIIAKTIKLHGLRGKAFPEDFQNLTEEEARAVDLVSQIDDIANGVQCVGYLLREGQEQKKNQSNGGFIPDENATSKKVSPKVMELFRESTAFNRNAECKTYPDYYLFGAFLATRSLKNPATRELTKELMSLPTSVMEHEIIDGQDALVSKKFASSIEAFEYIFRTQMEEKDANEAYNILLSYYHTGQAPNESQQ